MALNPKKVNNEKGKLYLFFDIDNTLFPTSEFANIARENAIKAIMRMGLEYDEKKLMKLLLDIIKREGSNYDGHFNEMCKILDVPKKEIPKYVAAAISAYHDTKSAIQPYPDVPKMLLGLKLAGYKLYIATDGKSVKQWDKLIRIGVEFLFERIFTSEDLRVKKSTEFYKKIEKKMGIPPEECVMVGDRENMDITPAKKAGWKTILVQRGPYGSKVKNTVANVKVKSFSELYKKIDSL